MYDKDGVLVVCGEFYNLGKIDRSVVVLSPPPLYLVIENSKNTRNELARPVIDATLWFLL